LARIQNDFFYCFPAFEITKLSFETSFIKLTLPEDVSIFTFVIYKTIPKSNKTKPFIKLAVLRRSV